MKMTALILLTTCLTVSAEGLSQKVTLSAKDAPLEKVIQQIKNQTGYSFFYNEDWLEKARTVTIDVKNMDVEKALDFIFKDQPLDYNVINNTIVLKLKASPPAPLLEERGEENPPPIDIRGTITDEEGNGIIATITEKGTSNATTSDAEGYYELKGVDEKATLVISAVNIESYEVKVNSRTFINATVTIKVTELDAPIVVAYNTTTQRSNTGAVTVVKGEQIQNLPNRSFDKSLQGLVPGLQITQGSGQPGGGVSNFVLRGIATGGNPLDGSTVRNPLIVIDGVPVYQDPAQLKTSSITFHNPMAQLNPSDIETITVLKDAAAVALYGSRASNGVILVTTKRGKAGKTVFNFRHQTDISTRLTGNIEMLSQQEYLELLYETYRNTDPAYWTDDRIKSDLISKFPYQVSSPGDTSFYPASNWLDELYNNAATTFVNEFSMSGGNEKSNFYLNLEYTKQNGIEKATGYDRKSIRFNYENKLAPWIKVGLNSTLSYNVQKYGFSGTEGTTRSISPLNPIRSSDGEFIYNYSWGFTTPSSLTSNSRFSPNPLASAKLNINQNISYRGLSKLYGELNFLKYFTLNTAVGVDFMLTEAKEKVHPLLGSSDVDPGIGSIEEKDIRNANIITTNILRFDKQFKRVHSINILVGQEAQVLTNKFQNIVAEGLTNNPLADQLYNLNYSGGNITDANGLSIKQTLLSYFSQINYGLMNKYFISASFRRDGSSLFGENKRFGNHWSIGTGWLVSSESFMQNTRGWLDYLKLRGSIGYAGNSAAIANTLKYNPVDLANYLNNPAIYPDLLTSPGNPGIQWEKTLIWDAGLEFRLLKSRVAFTADIYNRKTSEVIAKVNLPYATGAPFVTDNIGDLKNTGIELSIAGRIINGKNFQWNLNGNWSKNKNKLLRSFYQLENVISGILANGEGENYNSYYMVRWAGVDPVTGKPQWYDADGKTTDAYSSNDRVFVGKPQPDGFGAVTNNFTYRGVELSAMLYYQYGFQIYDGTNTTFAINDGFNPYVNQSKVALNRWQKPGDITANPRRLLLGRPAGGSPDNGWNASTRYLFDGDFIRLSNVILAYNFPKKLLDRLRISMLKIYVQGNNLATWTKYSGQDPEAAGPTGQSSPVYPIQRSYSIGLNLNF